MRVGLVIYGSLDTLTGGYLYDRMLASKLRERGDDVQVISLRRRRYASNLADNITFRNPPDLDLVVQDELNHPSLFLANRRFHAPPIVSIVHHLRSSERRAAWQNYIYQSIERSYLDSVDAFIFNSSSTRASVVNLSRASKPGVVATPGGDRLGQSTEDDVQQRARSSGPLRLIYLAGVTPGKGLEVLLDALSMVPPTDAVLEVVGSLELDPHFADRMRQKAAGLRVPVTFRGVLGDDATAERLRASQVMVMPSYFEGFGISYLEGMAHGLPALATHAGAIPDLVSDGANGYLVKPGDSGALAVRIMELVHDRKLLERLSLAALQRFRSQPTWDESMERIRDFLVSIARD